MPKVDNSGYILVDFSKVDHNKHSQVIDGFYADCEKLISNEKFVLLSNVNEVSTTPIPSIVLFKNSIYNVITFEYVYTISSGDVVVVTKNEGGITVDVIDDSIIALNKTWSSSKINEMLPDNAGQIIYDNTVSHLQSNRVQSAIDELVTIVNGVDSRVVVTETDISTIKNQLITIANEISLLHNAANIEVSSGVSVTDVLTSLDNNKQDVLTAGNNVSISNNVISAVDTTYTAGNNVNISADNVISATDTVYGAGDGIDITNNVIAVDPSTANITADNVSYGSGTVKDKLDNIGTISRSNWIATQSSGNGTVLTDILTLNEGDYIVQIKAPNTDNNIALIIRNVDTMGELLVTSLSSLADSLLFIHLAGVVRIQAVSAQSATVNFSNLSRGGLNAIKIS